MRAVSPLAPGQWKAFLAVYAALYATVGTLMRPFRLAAAISFTPVFEATLQHVRARVPYAQSRPTLNRGLALVVLILVGNVGSTCALTALGIWLAATVTGVPVFPN